MIESQSSGLKWFIRLSRSSNEVVDKLGPSANLVVKCNSNQAWNFIAVPSPNGFQLLIQTYPEKISFPPVGTPVANRGGQNEQFIVALVNDFTVIDISAPGVLHVENDKWLNLSEVEKQNLQSTLVFPITRQANVPYRDVVTPLETTNNSKDAPPISEINTIPYTGESAPSGFIDPYLHTNFPNFNAGNPNVMLTKAIAGKTIVKVTTLEMDSANQGGRINNIPFLENQVNPTDFKCSYWIENVLNQDRSTSFQELQYSQ